MLVRAFLSAVQMASLGSAFMWSSSPEIGTLTWMPLSASVTSATIMPSGRPIFFFTSSFCRVGATVRFLTMISLSAVS